MKKKFIQYSTFFYPLVGGQEKVVIDLASTMRSQGFECLVFQPLNFAILKDWKKFKLFQSDNKVKIIPIPTIGLLIYPLLKFLAFQKSNDLIQLINWLSFNFSLRMFSIFFDKRALNLCHYHFLYNPLRKLNPVIFSHGVEWQRPPKTLLDRLRLRKLELLLKDDEVKLSIIANDRDYLNEVKNMSHENTNMKSVFIPNGVDTNLFAPSTVTKSSNSNIIGMIRNVRQDRGILEGIKAFKIFCIDQKKNYQLDIYGHYNMHSEYFRHCLSEANSTLVGNVNFKGPISNELLAAVYPRLYLTLVPSQSLEGTSLSALESMSCGVPCVVTPVGGLNDLPACRAKTKTPEDLAEAMKSVSLNYEEISRAQYQETVNHFSKLEWEKKVCFFLKGHIHGEQ